MLASRRATEDSNSNLQVEQTRKRIAQGRVAITEATKQENALDKEFIENQTRQ